MRPHARNAYDIRLDLLVLARQVLSDRHAAEAQATTTSRSYPSTAPTTEEIIAEAEKLNAFVSKST